MEILFNAFGAIFFGSMATELPEKLGDRDWKGPLWMKEIVLLIAVIGFIYCAVSSIRAM